MPVGKSIKDEREWRQFFSHLLPRQHELGRKKTKIQTDLCNERSKKFLDTCEPKVVFKAFKRKATFKGKLKAIFKALLKKVDAILATFDRWTEVSFLQKVQLVQGLGQRDRFIKPAVASNLQGHDDNRRVGSDK